jgi:hypothetical protein
LDNQQGRLKKATAKNLFGSLNDCIPGFQCNNDWI